MSSKKVTNPEAVPPPNLTPNQKSDFGGGEKQPARKESKQSKPAERQAAAKPTALPERVQSLCKKHGVARPLAWAIREDGTAVVIAEDGRKFVG